MLRLFLDWEIEIVEYNPENLVTYTKQTRSIESETC